MNIAIYNNENISLRFREWLLLTCIFLILRGSAALVLEAFFYIEKDVDWYATIARNLLAGHGFVITPGGETILWRGPVYPLFLAFIWQLAGDTANHGAILIAQVLVDTATALLIFCIGKHFFGNKTGLLAALIFVVYPISVYYCPRFLPTTLYTFFITFVVATLIFGRVNSKIWQFLLSGFFAGIAALIKASAIYLIPFITLVWIMKYRNDWRKTAFPVIVFLLGTSVVLVPWGVRNYMHTGIFSVSGTSGGYSLWLATRIDSQGREEEELEGEMLEDYLAKRQEIVASARLAAGFDSEQEVGTISRDDNEAFQRVALNQIRNNWYELAKISMHKAYRFWFEIYHLDNRWARTYIFLMQLVLLSFAVWGGIVAWRNKIDIFPIVTTIVYFTLLHSVSISTLRYSVPLIPLVSIFTSAGFFAMLSYLTSRLNNRLPSSLKKTINS